MALITFSRIVIVSCVVATALQLVLCSAAPIYLDIPPQTFYPSNGKLQKAIKLGEGLLPEPEDVTVDKNGVLYTTTRDGKIVRIYGNGTVETWYETESGNMLGVDVTEALDLIICDASVALRGANNEGVKVLTAYIDGHKISLQDDVKGAADGVLYFSEACTKYNFSTWQLDLLESEPHGRLLKYDPSTKTTSVLLSDLAFSNGVAVSKDQKFVVVCETWEYRCTKYWIKGNKTGQSEIFVDKLPGRPDNINVAPDGTFWIAVLKFVPIWPRFVYDTYLFKLLAWAYPTVMSKWVIYDPTDAMVVHVGRDGKVLRYLDDPTGEVMRFVTSAYEYDGHLYFGSLSNNFVGKLSLADI